MNLHDRLEAMCEAVPPGGSVTIPRDWLAAELDHDESMDDDPLTDLTLQQVADAFDRSVGTVRTWCNTGRLDAYKLGKEWRIPRASLAALRKNED
jgi:excisionase family DNA binding protein